MIQCSTSTAIAVCFGYHTVKTVEEGSSTLNLLNGFGYLPIAGMITAIIRIFLTVKLNKENENPLSFKITFISRAILEALGVGLLFLIPDLIVSLGRHFFHTFQTPDQLFGSYTE